MRKCINCNKLCPDTEKFCQTCGLPTSVVDETAAAAEHVPLTQHDARPIFSVVRLPAALPAVAAILIFPKKAKGDPMHRFFDAQENFVENKLLAKENLTVESLMCGEYKPSIQEVSTDAELSFDLSGIDIGSLGLEELGLGDIDLSEKLSKLSLFFQIDSKQTDALTGVQLRYNGSSIISATIESTDKGLSVYIPELSEKCYELSSEFFTKLMSGDSDLADADLPEQVEVKFDRVADLKKSYEALKKDYEEIFYKGFAVEDFEQKDRDCKLNNLDVTVSGCRTITYAPNAERLASMLLEMAERIKTDKALSDHILTLMEKYLGESGMNFMLSALCSNCDIELGDNGLIPVFEKLADSLNKDRDALVKSIDDSNFIWRVVTHDDDVILQHVGYNDGYNDGSVYFEHYGENIYLSARDGDNAFEVKSDLKKDGNILGGKINMSTGGENKGSAEITIEGCDSSSKSALGFPRGKYNIELSETSGGSGTLNISVEVVETENGGTDHRVTINGLGEVVGEDAPDKLAFNLHTSDKDSTVSRPSAEVVRIESEEQLNGIVEEMGENLSGVMMKLMLALMF